MKKDEIIDRIIFSFTNYNLRDIKLIGDLAEKNSLDFVLAEFTLCTCLIDQLSGFRYNRIAVKSRFIQFVDEYLSRYNSKFLYEDLRIRIIHNYSVGENYQLTRKASNSQTISNSNDGLLSLDQFISDIEDAMNKYFVQLKNDKQIRENAINWYNKNKIFIQVQ